MNYGIEYFPPRFYPSLLVTNQPHYMTIIFWRFNVFFEGVPGCSAN